MEKGFVKNYWEGRYKQGGNSGQGSHDLDSITFKADYVNSLIVDNEIKSVVEVGCGDGNQLRLLTGYDKYIGYDISETIVNKCTQTFSNDETKEFINDVNKLPKSDLVLSLDVIYHLVEDDVFVEYMDKVFSLGNIVCLYTTNSESTSMVNHVKHRNVEKYVNDNFKDFEMVDKKPFTKHNVLFLTYKKL